MRRELMYDLDPSEPLNERYDRSLQVVPPFISKPPVVHDPYSDTSLLITRRPSSIHSLRPESVFEGDAQSVVSIAWSKAEHLVSDAAVTESIPENEVYEVVPEPFGEADQKDEIRQEERYAVDGGVCLARNSSGALHETAVPNVPTRISSLTMVTLPPPYYPHTDDPVSPPPPLPELPHGFQNVDGQPRE